MAAFSIKEFESSLLASLPQPTASEFCVALSGGLDSIVLIHALAQLRSAHHWRVRAIHVNHQLQVSSDSWQQHCLQIGQQLNVDVHVERIVVSLDGREGTEAAARTARYDAMRRNLRAGEILLTAHHADDQLETMLLALMRGSGAQGLAAMPTCKPFGLGWHVRPLLGFTRTQLVEWAGDHELQFFEDPSNDNVQFDRNYLRHEVLPRLRARWPAAAQNATRSAGHLAEANALLEEAAQADWQLCGVGSGLRIEALRTLSAPRRKNLLRYWLRAAHLRMPSQRKLLGLEKDLFNSAPDSTPCVQWDDAEVRWHGGIVYASRKRPAMTTAKYVFNKQDKLQLPCELGAISLKETTSEQGLSLARLPQSLQVRFRVGGERIQLPGREHRTDLKKLLQERHVLPWWRDRLPLVFAGSRIVAVADLFIASEFVAEPGEPSMSIVWSDKPQITSARTGGNALLPEFFRK